MSGATRQRRCQNSITSRLMTIGPSVSSARLERLASYLQADLASHLVLPEGSKIIYNKGHGASLWSQAGKISVELGDGTVKSFFIKLTGTDVGKHVAHAEFVAMSRLHEYIPESTPKPIGWGSFANKPDQCFYMCDFKDLVGDSLPSPRDFCTQIAAMHMASQADQANPDMFGYEHVTCDGPVVMPNTWSLSWEAHFLQKLKDTFVLDEQVHGECDDYAIIKPILYDKVIPRLLRPLETGGNSIKPVGLVASSLRCVAPNISDFLSR